MYRENNDPRAREMAAAMIVRQRVKTVFAFRNEFMKQIEITRVQYVVGCAKANKNLIIIIITTTITIIIKIFRIGRMAFWVGQASSGAGNGGAGMGI